ncbi:MAG: PilN domain-containing protein [Gammaproteobacteria bacterium]
MKQQINLYQLIFRKQKKVFSAVAMLQISIFFMVVFGAVYAYNLVQLRPFQKELDKTTTQLEKLTKQIEIVSKKLPGRNKSKLLENEIARLTAELERMKKVEEALSKGSFGNMAGFSGYFEALARGHVTGTWLTGIHIARGGGSLSFDGKSINAELVPVYIKNLAAAPVFDKRTFNILELQREKDSDFISFNVATGG